MSGELALQTMSKRQKKKMLDEKNKEEEEERQLRERILKANKEASRIASLPQAEKETA